MNTQSDRVNEIEDSGGCGQGERVHIGARTKEPGSHEALMEVILIHSSNYYESISQRGANV